MKFSFCILMVLFIAVSSAEAIKIHRNTGDVLLTWDEPTTNADGTPLTDLDGYIIYYGFEPGTYIFEIDVGIPGTCQFILGISTCTYLIEELPSDCYYFALRAYDTSFNLSDFSNEVMKDSYGMINIDPDPIPMLPDYVPPDHRRFNLR